MTSIRLSTPHGCASPSPPLPGEQTDSAQREHRAHPRRAVRDAQALDPKVVMHEGAERSRAQLPAHPPGYISDGKLEGYGEPAARGLLVAGEAHGTRLDRPYEQSGAHVELQPFLVRTRERKTRARGAGEQRLVDVPWIECQRLGRDPQRA